MSAAFDGPRRRLVVGLAGPWPTPRELAWIAGQRPAGVILFGRNIEGDGPLRDLCGVLHEAVPGLEVCVDHEGGPVSVAAAAVGRPPAAATLGLLDDPGLTRRVHAETGAQLAALGIDRVLGPVADVLVQPRNPVLGVRAFGADPELVARHVAAAVAGLIAGGVRACPKHWPGHGGTAWDSHQLLGAAVGGFEPAPFAAALAAGADALMLGHLSRGPGRPPATLDPAEAAAARRLGGAVAPLLFADDITMGALRGPLARQGVAVPPGGGLVDPGDLTDPWLAALAAGGCDRLLVRGVPGLPLPAPGGAAAARDAARGPAAVEAMERLAERLPPDFGLPGLTVAALDRCGTDRWGPLEGGARDFPGPAQRQNAGTPGAAGAERLVVTSHRPLDLAAETAAAWTGDLAPAGMAVATGHPALAEDLRALLPAAWRVSWLPEWPEQPAQKN